MSKILLVNPLITDFAAYDLWLYPFGLDLIAYIINKYSDSKIKTEYIDFLRINKNKYNYKSRSYSTGKFHKRGIKRIKDGLQDQYRIFSLYGIPETDILRSLNLMDKKDTKAILITSLMSYWYEGVLYSIDILRKVFPDIPIIIGGMWPIQYPEHCRNTLKNKNNIHISSSHDLYDLFEIMSSLNIMNFSDKPNIYKDFKDFVQQDIPDYLDFYPIITSIGCPMKCDFCLSPVLHKHNYIQRNYDNIIKEILKGSEMRKDMVFFDDSLMFNRDRYIKPILYEMLEKKIVHNRFHLPNGIQTRMIDEEMAYLLKKLNFKSIRLSVEGFDLATSAFSKDKINYSSFVNVLKLLDKTGISRSDIGIYLLFGLPGQDFDNLREFAIEYAKKGYYIGLSEISPVPGTRIHELYKEEFPQISMDPIYINNSTFLHSFLNISEKFIDLKKEIRNIIKYNHKEN